MGSMTLWSKISHWFGRCPYCEVYSTDDGIGGKCIDCGKIWGWVTRQELRDYAIRKQGNNGSL